MSDPASSALMASLAGGGIAAGGGIIGTAMNINFQREVNAHNEELMREAWGREDSAVQRRAADMEAAGFNPVLATGAAASSSPAVRAEAPQVRENVGLSAVQGAAAARDMIIKDRQAQLLQKQAEGLDLDNQLKRGTLDPNIEVALERAAQAVRETEIKNIDAATRVIERDLKAQEFRMQNQDVAVKEEWTRLSAALDYQIKEQRLAEAQAMALKAIAMSELLGQEARDYTSIGISESVVDRIYKLIDLVSSLLGGRR